MSAPIQATIRLDATVDVSTRQKLSNGYLRCTGRLTRAGVIPQPGRLFGIDEDIVYVNQPMALLSDKKALQTLDGVDITLDHPDNDGDVRADNWKEYSVGHVGNDGRADDQDFLVATMLLKDPKAIAAIERGEDQLSVGYQSTFLMDSPNTLSLIAPPTYNHIALVDKGAAGPEAKVLASKEKRMDAQEETQEVLESTASAASVDINLNVKQEPLSEFVATTNSVVAAAETETEEEDTATEDTAELVDLAVRASSYRPEIAASIAGKSKREVLEMALDGVVTDMDSRNDDYLMAAFDMASEKQTEATEIRETFRGSSFEVGGGTPPTTGRARTVLTLRKQLRGNK